MYKIIITSSNDYNVLRNISKILVNKKLSPCTHIIKDVDSFYLWEGVENSTNENLLLIKTFKKNISQIEKIISNYHNYEIPEIISHDFNIISIPYKKWFDDTERLR